MYRRFTTRQVKVEVPWPGQEQIKIDQTSPAQSTPDQATQDAAASPSPASDFHHAQAAAPAAYYSAPSGLDMTSLPDGIAKWHEQRGLQILWLLSSIFMVMLDIVGLDVGFLAGLLGIIGSSLAVCNCFQGMDLRSIVKVWVCIDDGDLACHTLLLASVSSVAALQAVRILGYLTSVISGLIGVLLLSALNSWECEELHEIEQCQNVKYL